MAKVTKASLLKEAGIKGIIITLNLDGSEFDNVTFDAPKGSSFQGDHSALMNADKDFLRAEGYTRSDVYGMALDFMADLIVTPCADDCEDCAA